MALTTTSTLGCALSAATRTASLLLTSMIQRKISGIRPTGRGRAFVSEEDWFMSENEGTPSERSDADSQTASKKKRTALIAATIAVAVAVVAGGAYWYANYQIGRAHV